MVKNDFENHEQVIDSENEALTNERLSLVKASHINLKIVLNLLGIEAKETMQYDF